MNCAFRKSPRSPQWNRDRGEALDSLSAQPSIQKKSEGIATRSPSQSVRNVNTGITEKSCRSRNAVRSSSLKP